jgi:hypothetical protein
VLVDKEGNPWPLQRTELGPAIDEIIRQTNVYEVIAEDSGVYLFANREKRQEAEQEDAPLQSDRARSD